MRERLLILAGLAVLVGLLTSPLWQGLAAREAASAPQTAVRAGLTHCIRDTAWMRRNHMKLLMQARDAAVHQGIRNPDESLSGCMNCHQTRLADGSYPAVSSPQFFCKGCHAYAGVETDCFSCHSNRPDTAATEASVAASATVGGASAAVGGASAAVAGAAPPVRVAAAAMGDTP